MAMRLKRLLSISRRLDEDQTEGIAAGYQTWHSGPRAAKKMPLTSVGATIMMENGNKDKVFLGGDASVLGVEIH